MVMLATAKTVIAKPYTVHMTSPKAQSPWKQGMIMKGYPIMTMAKSPPTHPIMKIFMCVRSRGVDLNVNNTATLNTNPSTISTTKTNPIAV
ncbi:hypothetical protein DPMN_084790 [Dreissena polymorpha]|uniref:Uncharacterized protein n=1 Tax=Dreissena polymorpha TaxID=45954 RepID=A0A9D3YFI9_DREPO|nr:hypothetical protein DPMN_084790 [Dreissena polymorpha]